MTNQEKCARYDYLQETVDKYSEALDIACDWIAEATKTDKDQVFDNLMSLARKHLGYD